MDKQAVSRNRRPAQTPSEAALQYAPPPPCHDAERVRAIKQSVLSDVSCVLARAGGADIDPKRAVGAARNVCEILFSHPMRPRADIPKLFWDSPLGRAVGVCCGETDDTNEAMVKTILLLPHAISEKLRLEAEQSNKSVSDLIAERLMS